MISSNIAHQHHGAGHIRLVRDNRIVKALCKYKLSVNINLCSRKPLVADPEEEATAAVSGSPRTMEERTNAALDRNTIKNISKLIYERDSGKIYPPSNSNNNANKSSPRRNYH